MLRFSCTNRSPLPLAEFITAKPLCRSPKMPSIQKRQPRLKDSCDTCSSSKVRCDKDKPSCSRCSEKGLSCVYSFSRRAGRRNTSGSVLPRIVDRSPTSSPASMISTPSASSLSPQRDFSVDSSENDDKMNLWPFPPPHPPYPMEQVPADFAWSTPNLQNGLLNQPVGIMPSHMPMDSTFMAPVNVLDAQLPPFDPLSITSHPAVEQHKPMHRSSSSSSSTCSSTSLASTQVDALHDELANLTTFAESMEKKFDTVVRQRVQYRNVYNEFGVPVDDLELPSTSTPDMPQQGGSGHVSSPDLSEISFYYSLAELKRRLKWVKEDVTNLKMSNAGVC